MRGIPILQFARVRTISMLVFTVGCIAWLDPYAGGRQANQLYAAGKYDDAVSKYNEALVDQPDSPQLHYNLGVVTYKQGKYDDAIKAFSQVPTSDDDPKRTARVALGIGNAKFKLGEAAETADPKTALTNYAEALAMYRRGMGADPADLDLKFNHEFVEKKLTDLKKKLEEQQQQKDQQQNQDQRNQDQQKGEEQKQQDQQQHAQDQQGDQQQQQQPDQKQQGEQPDQQQQQQQPAGGAVEQAEKKDGEMSQQEAAALLDSQRDQEVQPADVIKKLQGAAVAEPAQDW